MVNGPSGYVDSTIQGSRYTCVVHKDFRRVSCPGDFLRKDEDDPVHQSPNEGSRRMIITNVLD